MATRDIAVLGASAGGIEALRDLVGGLPADHHGVVLVALHMGAGGGHALAQILDRAGPLPALLLSGTLMACCFVALLLLRPLSRRGGTTGR